MSASNIIKPGEEYIFEETRLASFAKWPQWAQAAPVILVRSGFYYQNYKDEVICFSCSGRIRGWKNNEDPDQVHRKNFPSCPHITGKNNTNIPMTALNGIPKMVNGWMSSHHNEMTNTNQITPKENPDVTIYEGRLATFTNWPQDSPMLPNDLARAGFWYTGRQDVVECFTCKGRIRRWEPTDTALGEHRRHYPNCSFLLNFDFSTTYYNTAPSVSQNSTLNQIGPTNPNIDFLMSEESPIVTERPKVPQYAIESKRLSSFDSWPRYKTQKPADLADAGFFYAGFNDNVKCFFCGGGLRNWEDDDVPWEEHARWFPKCGWVKQCKGVGFIKRYAHQKKDPSMKPASNNFINVEKLMESPASKAVEEMGYDKDMIKEAIKQKFIDTDKTKLDTMNAESLLNAVFEIEDELKKNPKPKTIPVAQQNGVATNIPANATASKTSTPKKELNHLSETEILKQEYEGLKEKSLCKICFENTNSVLLLPCAHLCCCEKCLPNLKTCPMCRSVIKGSVKTYMS